MKQTHGLIVKKVEHAFANDEMAVRVYDGNDFVGIAFSDKTQHPKFTAEEAKFLAKQLVEAANRLSVIQK
jgi:hypothetical protein